MRPDRALGDLVIKALTAVLLGIAISLGGSVAAHAALGLQLFVHMHSGTIITIDADSSDSIENVKQKIRDQTAIPTEQLLLTYAGITLLDGRTLADYNIQDDADVQLGYVLPFALTSAPFPPFSLAADYTAAITTTATFTPPLFALTAGALPAGVTFDATTATFAGRPTVAGPYAFTITATRDDGTPLVIPFAGSIAPAAAAPADPLVETGVDPLLPLGLAGALILAGAGVLLGRRTRRA